MFFFMKPQSQLALESGESQLQKPRQKIIRLSVVSTINLMY